MKCSQIYTPTIDDTAEECDVALSENCVIMTGTYSALGQVATDMTLGEVLSAFDTKQYKQQATIRRLTKEINELKVKVSNLEQNL